MRIARWIDGKGIGEDKIRKYLNNQKHTIREYKDRQNTIEESGLDKKETRKYVEILHTSGFFL